MDVPGPVPLHVEPLTRDVTSRYNTRFYKDKQAYRLPTMYGRSKRKTFKRFSNYPHVGTFAEYEGGGDESRLSNGLRNYNRICSRIHPVDAIMRGYGWGGYVGSPPEAARSKVKAMVTERVAQGVAFMPFHFGDYWQERTLGWHPQGRSLRWRSVQHVRTQGMTQ